MEKAMERKVKEVHATEITEPQSPAAMIRDAISGSADLEKLGKLLEIQERWEANEARKAYHRAMTAFKANPPSIEKDKHVSYGNTKYNHATLANVTEKINAALSVHGLSASWKVSQNGVVSVTCKITHEQGHSEETTLCATADNSGAKNDIQAIGSAITYLQRYTLLALTGLAAHEADDDGGTTGEVISNAEAAAISVQLKELGIEVGMFTNYMGVDKIENIRKGDFQKANEAIKAKKDRTAKK